MKIGSKTMGVEYRETALWYHHDILVYGQKRGHVEYKQNQDPRWCFYENSIVNTNPRVFDTQDELEQYLAEAYMNLS